MQFGLIGEKLGHSFSKVIHQHFADYAYDLAEIAPEKLDGFMKEADFSGINVTIPYKQTVMPYLDEIDEAARKIGAVNTVVKRGGRLYGFNTDFGGMKKMILRCGFDFRGEKVLVLGTGGTSKTAEAAAIDLGTREVYKVGRSSEINYDNVKALHGDAAFIINTTPLGMYPNSNSQALTLDGFDRLCGVIDVVYNPLKTRLVLEAESRGVKSTGGLYMLVSQAVLAGEIFLGKGFDSTVYDETYKYVLSGKENIVLTGMPGSGKTTVGRLLAEKTGRQLVDTDEMIVSEQGMPVSEIFSKYGEEHFRMLEADAIRRASQKNGLIIATGGGAVMREENVSALKSNGRIFFLNRPLEAIIPTSDRPLSSDREALERRFCERYPTYRATCDEEIIPPETAEDTAKLILEKLK